MELLCLSLPLIEKTLDSEGRCPRDQLHASSLHCPAHVCLFSRGLVLCVCRNLSSSSGQDTHVSSHVVSCSLTTPSLTAVFGPEPLRRTKREGVGRETQHQSC